VSIGVSIGEKYRKILKMIKKVNTEEKDDTVKRKTIKFEGQ
jgi:hypothetical protein